MPDLSDLAMSKRYLDALLDALLYLGTPRWLARFLVSQQRRQHRRRFKRQPAS
jgi:hypothetical protein